MLGEGILSDINYGSFRAWLNSERGQTELRLGADSSIISKVVLIVHQDASEGAFLESHAAQAPYRVVPCQAVGCERCSTRKGGFRFPYCSSLWTPLLAFHNEQTIAKSPNAARHLCQAVAFPLGLRRRRGGDHCEYFSKCKRERLQEVRGCLADPVLQGWVRDVPESCLEQLDSLLVERYPRQAGAGGYAS